MKVHHIFTPNDTPTVTYVDRRQHQLEERLRTFHAIPKQIVSISGPSKSGKTVLIKKVVSEKNLITILGAGVSSAENLWDHVLNWIGTPSETTDVSGTSTFLGSNAEISGKLKLPVIAEGGAKAEVSGAQTWNSGQSKTFKSGGLDQVIRIIGGSEFVVFIDDFHYIKTEVQNEIGKQIKAAAENGVKIFTASVPHRADDVVRSNPELRGRVAAVNLSYWTVQELLQISEKGFSALNTEIAPAVLKRFAEEAFGSPQLMQSICLNLCFVLNLNEPLKDEKRTDVSQQQISEILLQTSSFTDFSKMVVALHTGPRTRGTERKIHLFLDGSRGDVYRSILLAIKQNPAALSFSYDNVLTRVRAACISEAPVGSSISSALEQMQLIGQEIQPGTSPLSWSNDTLDIADPYLIFYLRSSDRLAFLGQPAS